MTFEIGLLNIHSEPKENKQIIRTSWIVNKQKKTQNI